MLIQSIHSFVKQLRTVENILTVCQMPIHFGIYMVALFHTVENGYS